jgi:3-isopropylmalate/(R)-2-methylmalate dehydratase small subunit
VEQRRIEALWSMIENDPTNLVIVDLVVQEIRWALFFVPFQIDDYMRWRFLENLDNIEIALKHTEGSGL